MRLKFFLQVTLELRKRVKCILLPRKSAERREKDVRSVVTQVELIEAKVGLGLVLAEETTYLLSGDFEYPLHKLVKSTPKGLMLVTGIHYFGYEVGTGSVSLIGLEAGVDYHYGLTKELHLFGGARVTMGRASVEVETPQGNFESTETNYYLTPVIGIAYDLKGVTLGGEIRLPFEEDLDATYILFTGKFSLN